MAESAEEIHDQVIRGAEDRVRMMARFASGEAERGVTVFEDASDGSALIAYDPPSLDVMTDDELSGVTVTDTAHDKAGPFPVRMKAQTTQSLREQKEG
ncbi:hypothetical protein [Granulibacter bethesdensis]|uniref:hypothetical protein n=1 Tax=Granulibacter bethesdensis TaxID=364410 RepID=UPI000AFA1EF0|nr:hypothetical protein [Granulibacter bethesdensis]